MTMASRKEVALSTIRVTRYWIEDALKMVEQGRPIEAGAALRRAQEHLVAAKTLTEDLVYPPTNRKTRI
jgi:hypothetical protein